METETIFPLERIGKIVRNIRKDRALNQIECYRILFPEKNLSDENIKKKMNAIENGKRVSVDFDLLYRLHKEFDLSMDYLFGYETEFPNYESKNAVNYTGLSVETIELMHKLAEDKKIIVPNYSPNMSEKEAKKRMELYDRKFDAEWVSKIVNILFTENKDYKGNYFSNLSVLYDIYMICASEPSNVRGIPQKAINDKDDLLTRITKAEEINPKSLTMKDAFGVVHPIDVNKINQQIWKDQLICDLDKVSSRVKKN